MNATLYDPSDVAFGAQPRLMCAACGKREVGIYEPVCPECRKSLEQAGILKPAAKPLTFEDVTPMTEAPPKGTWYWVPQPFRSRGVEAFIWDGDDADLSALRHRMAYLDKGHALIAARHIFGLKGGEL